MDLFFESWSFYPAPLSDAEIENILKDLEAIETPKTGGGPRTPGYLTGHRPMPAAAASAAVSTPGTITSVSESAPAS